MRPLDSQPVPLSTPIRDRFLADHERLDAALARLLAAFEANDQEDVARTWVEFESGLIAHLEAEETHLIPALHWASERAARVVVAEHTHIRARLTDLGAGIDLHVVRLDSVRSFIDELRAHAQSEERLLYRWGDEHLHAPDRTLLLDALSAATRACEKRRRA